MDSTRHCFKRWLLSRMKPDSGTASSSGRPCPAAPPGLHSSSPPTRSRSPWGFEHSLSRPVTPPMIWCFSTANARLPPSLSSNPTAVDRSRKATSNGTAFRRSTHATAVIAPAWTSQRRLNWKSRREEPLVTTSRARREMNIMRSGVVVVRAIPALGAVQAWQGSMTRGGAVHLPSPPSAPAAARTRNRDSSPDVACR